MNSRFGVTNQSPRLELSRQRQKEQVFKDSEKMEVRRRPVFQTAAEKQLYQPQYQQKRLHKVRKQRSLVICFGVSFAIFIITCLWFSISAEKKIATEKTTPLATNHAHRIPEKKRATFHESRNSARGIPGIELQVDGIQLVHPGLSYPARWVF